AEPGLVKRQDALDQAHTQVNLISTDGTIQPVSNAIDSLQTSVGHAAAVIDGIGNAARLLPSMLGADGPRNYLLLFQNTAELRATGGVPGALALLHTDGGRVTLAAQTSAAEFREFDPPVMKLPIETAGLYGELPAQHIQEVN